MTRTTNQRESSPVADAIFKAASIGMRWFLAHVLWIWPKGLAAFVARPIAAYPLILGPVLLALVAAPFVMWWGIENDLWGQNVKTVWGKEDEARKTIKALEREIDSLDIKKPNRVYDWEKFAPDYAKRKRAREAWEARMDELEQQLKDAKIAVPSWRSPSPPQWEVTTRQGNSDEWDDKGLYQAHHLLFRTPYAAVPFAYFLIGLGFAWVRSPKRKALKWRRARRKTPQGAVLLGLNPKFRPHYLEPGERARHILVSGTTGSGKSEALKLFAGNDIASGRGLIFFDMKADREQAHALFEMACRAGRKDDFLHFTTDLGTRCHSYNGTSAGSTEVLTDRLMMAGEWSKEPYYPKVAEAALGRIIPALSSRDRIITTADIRLAAGEVEALRLISDWAHPIDRAKLKADLEHWAKYYEETAGLRHNLDQICRLRERMSTAVADIDIREVFFRNRILYVELNAQMHEKLATALARLMLEDFKQVSGHLSGHPDERHPFSLYIDEARYAVYPGFVGLITQCRSTGIGVVLATQSPLDFQEFGGQGVMRAITQNTNTKLFFCQVDHESAEYCARQAGTCETVKRTTQKVEGPLGGLEESGVYSDRDVREFIAHPDKLKRMPTGTALLIKGTEECEIIDVDYQPIRVSVEFAPTMPRKWKQGDQRWLGHERGALDLAALVAQQKAKADGENAKRSEDHETPEEEDKDDLGSPPVRRGTDEPPGAKP
jgi:hypothetical protein